MVETEASATLLLQIEDWTQTPWRTLERHVYRLQKRIYKAQQRGNVKAVHSLQRLLMKSRAARTLAVRRVTQDNQGRRTAGIDGVKAVGPLIRLLFVERLRTPAAITAQPVRRVLIPKAGKPHEFRPLGIPVLLDRAHQTLARLALQPQWEARFEPNSYGFRPGRSCHDALLAVHLNICRQDKYVLDADIKGCFENIDRHALLGQLDTIPAIRRAVKAWLKAGVLAEGAFVATPSGVPQGGAISPLLANVALHGLEEIATHAYRRRNTGLRLIRYADDFVVLCHDVEGIHAARAAIETWLASRGLHLNPTKTRITHTLHAYEGHIGFDFLGCHIRQYPVGKYRTGKRVGGRGQRRRAIPLGFKTFITPSDAAVKQHKAALARIVKRHRASSQTTLIAHLNPVIRGWCAYHRVVVASKAFRSCDNDLFALLWAWARQRHPRKTPGWIARTYWTLQRGAKWQFATRDGYRLRAHQDTAIKRHVKVRGNASPYDGNLTYWSRRLTDHVMLSATRGWLLARQKGLCPFCGLTFREDDVLDLDHIVPLARGGRDESSNQQLLHRHCHDQKTARDGSTTRVGVGSR
jgi:RNA-directed DNA polymerase